MKKRLLKSKCLFLFICRPGLSCISFILFFVLLLIASPAAFAQNIIKGHISSGNIALPGVTVQVKGTSISTQTDNNGDFYVSASGNATLSLSSVGYNTLEIQVENRSRINVQLEPSVKEMQQIVVVGYGTQKKQNVTSAVSTVNSKELTQSPSANVSNMLVGRVSGITAIQDQGAPGADQSRIYVRGISTTGNIDPLYVIDGIPRTSEDFQRLSSDEIESVSVLKDAAAAAVYGARGANGVILITTKRGSLGKTSFDYSFNYGLQKATRLPNYVNSYRYARLYNAALENEGRPEVFSEEDLSKFQDGSDPIFHPDTRWLDILGLGTLQKHNLTVNGGVEKVRYFLSFSYLNQKSLFNQQNSDLGFKRYNFRSNIDVQATATTKIALDVSGYLGMRTDPGSGYGFVFENINRDAPIYVGKYPNGLYGPGYSSRNGWAAVTESGYQKYGSNALLSRLEINQDIPFIKGLSVKGIAAFDFKPSTQKRWSLPMKLYNAVKDADSVRYDQISGSGTPSLYDLKSIERNLVLEAHAMYNRTFGRHNLGALLLYSQQSWNYDNTSASRSGFLSSQLDIINTGGTANQQTGGTSNQYRRQSTVGRLNYSFDQRYLMEFDFRYDGSDLFAQGKRFGFFPAMSLGWVLSREAFMEQISAIEFFKIRASYGELGNDQIGQYQYKDLYAFGAGVPLGDPSVYQNNIYLSRLANTDVTWEKSKKLNIGFESRIFKNFSLEADYFEEKRDDILGQRGATVPATLGASSILPFENFQKVNNKGFEVVAGFQKQLGRDFSFQTRFSVTHARNQVVDIGESSSVPDRIRQAGRPLYSIYGYKALGIFQSQEEINKVYGNNYPDLKPGDVNYADLNSDGKIDGNDITYIGSTNLPVNIYGLQASVNYKGIDVAMFWQAGTGNQQYFNNWMAKPFNQAGNALVAHEDYWRPDNVNARYPRILTSSSWNYDAVSTFWLYDTKYLRLKNLAIGYTLPKKWVKAIKSQNVRINFNASNLLTFSPYKEVDPENTNSNGHYYPQQVVYNFGASISF